MKTEIYISETCGLCYGSRNAIDKTRTALKHHNNIVIYKEILHNKNVMEELKNNGAILKESLEELTSNDYIVIRAHGEKRSSFEYFESNNIKYLDCTCPNVKAIHLLVREKSEQGYKIIIIGKHGYANNIMHPEVEGISGWCDSPLFIEEESEIDNLNLSFDKYYLVVQTTFNSNKARLYIDKIQSIMKRNKKIFEFRNTICNAQKNINIASLSLANKVDVMIVIGGKNSSNSKELYNNIRTVKETYFIENPSDILPLINNNSIRKGQKIGITAGASTMNEDIENIKNILEEKLN